MSYKNKAMTRLTIAAICMLAMYIFEKKGDPAVAALFGLAGIVMMFMTMYTLSRKK